MKLESLGSAAAGFFGASSVWLVHYGSSWAAVAVALVGAVLAVLEGEGRRPGSILGIVLFNMMIGALGGPVIAQRIGQTYDLDHPAVVLLLAFLVGYVAHDLFRSLREILIARLRKTFGGGAK